MLCQANLSWKRHFPHLPNLIWIVFSSKGCEISGSAGIIEKQMEKKKKTNYFCNSQALFPTIYWNKMSCMHMYNWFQMYGKFAKDILSRNNWLALLPSTWPPEQESSTEWNIFQTPGHLLMCLLSQLGEDGRFDAIMVFAMSWTCSLYTLLFCYSDFYCNHCFSPVPYPILNSCDADAGATSNMLQWEKRLFFSAFSNVTLSIDL